jgi:hypothetical protein
LWTLDSNDFCVAAKDWEEEIRLARIGYNGEVQRERCHKLSVAQMLPGLPPEDLCASIPIVEVVSGRVKDFLEHPEKAFCFDDSIEVLGETCEHSFTYVMVKSEVCLTCCCTDDFWNGSPRTRCSPIGV